VLAPGQAPTECTQPRRETIGKLRRPAAADEAEHGFEEVPLEAPRGSNDDDSDDVSGSDSDAGLRDMDDNSRAEVRPLVDGRILHQWWAFSVCHPERFLHTLTGPSLSVTQSASCTLSLSPQGAPNLRQCSFLLELVAGLVSRPVVSGCLRGWTLQNPLRT
jgi:hypothetical protein